MTPFCAMLLRRDQRARGQRRTPRFPRQGRKKKRKKGEAAQRLLQTLPLSGCRESQFRSIQGVACAHWKRKRKDGEETITSNGLI